MPPVSALFRASRFDPVCVVSKRGDDGKFHKIRQYNPWIKVPKGDPQPFPAVVDF